jgi:hypothetical protein
VTMSSTPSTMASSSATICDKAVQANTHIRCLYTFPHTREEYRENKATFHATPKVVWHVCGERYTRVLMEASPELPTHF